MKRPDRALQPVSHARPEHVHNRFALLGAKMLGATVSGLLAFALLTPAHVTAQQAPVCRGCENADSLISRYGLREAPTPSRELPGWAPPTRIVTIMGDEIAAAIRTGVPGVEVVSVPDLDAALPYLSETQVWLGPCSPELVRAGVKLRFIQLPSAGAEQCADLPGLIERDIVVTNMQSLYGPQIAETVIGMVLMFARHLHRYHAEQLAGQWSHAPGDAAAILASGMWELDGKIMLVVGLGGIGTEVAERANALGMRVWGTRNSSRTGPDFVERVGLASEALAMAAEADVVVNATPLTPATTGMFDAAFFNGMKDTAYFINVGRGESVVTADLVAALNAGVIAGAGLDVTDPEPLPPDHPLWRMPNVLLAPHAAAGSDYLLTRAVMLAVENMRRYAAGEALLSVVDLRRGY